MEGCSIILRTTMLNFTAKLLLFAPQKQLEHSLRAKSRHAVLLGRNSNLGGKGKSTVPEGSIYLEIPSRESFLEAFVYVNLKIQLHAI